MQLRQSIRSRQTAKGAAAGFVAGFVASFAMNKIQNLLARPAAQRASSHGAQSGQQGAPHHGVALELQKRGSDDAQDDAAVRVANAISIMAKDHKLTPPEKQRAGTLVHYAFGISTAAVYGALAEWLPGVKAGGGAAMGSLVWLAGDEMAVPAMGLSKGFSEYPLSTHASSLAAHLAYGLTTELVRSVVRSRL